MPLILNIDTSGSNASLCISKGKRVIAFTQNENQREHATWLHHAIRKLMQEQNLSLAALNAIAVSNGPGSYTGLRVGLAAAKGICYVQKIPLICLNTLALMAQSVADEADEWICPMIDARRNDVFAAIYDKTLNTIVPPQAITITPHSFADFLTNHKILFTGSGMLKFKNLSAVSPITYSQRQTGAACMPALSVPYFLDKQFADLAYCEPFYVKAPHIT